MPNWGDKRFQSDQKIDYPAQINYMIFYINTTAPQMVGSQGFSPTELLAIWMMVGQMDGLIRAGLFDTDKEKKTYVDHYDKEMQEIETKITIVETMGDGVTQKKEAAQNRQNALMRLWKLYNKQTQMLKPLGLIGERSAVIINGPTPDIQDEDYEPDTGEQDYSKLLENLSTPDKGKSVSETRVEEDEESGQ